MLMRSFILLLFVAAFISTSAQNTTTTLHWQVGHADHLTALPEQWVSATVPGAVQLDMANAEKYDPYYYAENWKDYLWMEDKFFVYKTSFQKPYLDSTERLFFVSKGIDYEFEIWLNGRQLLHQEGMFTPVQLDLSALVKEKNEMQVKIYPVPKMHKSPADRSQAAQSVKPAVSYGWDWHPRLVPSGIWDDTYLEVRHASHLRDVWVDYTLDDKLSKADIEIKVEGVQLDQCKMAWELRDARGKAVLQKAAMIHGNNAQFPVEFQQPVLWWPHDHGDPYLYTSVFRLLDREGKLLETHTSKVGFRKVALVMSEGAWNGPDGFPKGRSVAPIQVQINNRNIFAKGTNWVAPEIFPGVIDSARYKELLERALEANFNMLRIWGGCIVNKESFFELCDQLGIMVWEEFPLACNNYLGTPKYLNVLRQESESIIKRVRKHASLAMWCGGNELFNNWSGMTEQSLALRLLNSQCLLLDPKTPFIYTSPVIGMAHGHYVFRDWNDGEEVYARMTRARNTAYTEFGLPAPSSLEVLQTIIPADELWPPKPGTAWESHHAFKAWVGDTWLMQGMIEDYFGKSKDLEELIANGQLLQCEGYKAIYEEARRQKPYCTMALNWCFNEPWPTAANNTLVNWPNIPKPGFYAVSQSCRPFMASAKITKLKWKEGEEFSSDIWLLNDTYSDVASGKINVKLKAGDKELPLLSWDFDAPEANRNLAGPTVRAILPAWEVDRFELIVEVAGHAECTSAYTLLYVPKAKAAQKGTAIMNQ
ncbi:MAG: hypothetical protein HC819_14285 [Cyclobacteriaceae bacterium]|nr:hypothetical protein [Cyclobacteriaceae bacterium]